MSFESVVKQIARRAADLSSDAMHKLATARVAHEDDLTGVLVGSLATGLKQYETDGVIWDTAIMTHRRSGQEKELGADMLIHVELDTPEQKYSKGVLVQAKRIGPYSTMRQGHHDDLQKQCTRMLKVTPSSFVFAYDPHGLRCASATKVVGNNDLRLYDQCDWTAYRFFLELFRCPIGDPRITSADVKDLPTGYRLSVIGQGSLNSKRRPVRDMRD